MAWDDRERERERKKKQAVQQTAHGNNTLHSEGKEINAKDGQFDGGALDSQRK